jgi:hypothetical protein
MKTLFNGYYFCPLYSGLNYHLIFLCRAILILNNVVHKYPMSKFLIPENHHSVLSNSQRESLFSDLKFIFNKLDDDGSGMVSVKEIKNNTPWLFK